VLVDINFPDRQQIGFSLPNIAPNEHYKRYFNSGIDIIFQLFNLQANANIEEYSMNIS